MSRSDVPPDVEPQAVTGALNALEHLSLIGTDLDFRRGVKEAKQVIVALNARLRYEQKIRKSLRQENQTMREEMGF